MLLIIASVCATITMVVGYYRMQDRKAATMQRALYQAMREAYPKTTIHNGRL
jgi:hypothetical protein